MTNQPVAGWYPDPELPGQLRWWDGEAWTESRHPATAGPVVADGAGDPTTADAGGVGTSLPDGVNGAPTPKRKKRWVRGGAVVVVVAAVVLVLFLFVFGSDKPTFTWHGDKVDQADKTLEAAEANLQRQVKQRHGAVNDDSRCYFSKPEKAADGADKNDITGEVFCGPVLFVDGNTSRPWLRYGLDAAKRGDKVTLRAASSPIDRAPEALPRAVKLQRPDGGDAPSGAGGLKVPEPPRAEAGAFAVSPYSADGPAPARADVPDAASPVAMQGWTRGVKVEGYGPVKRYGEGDGARRAATHQKLIGARLSSLPGQSAEALGDSRNVGAARGALSVVVDGDTASAHVVGDLDASTDVVVAVSVPASAKSVDLVLTDGGLTQRVSLLTGKAAAANPKVLARVKPVQEPGPTGAASITFSQPGFVSATETVTMKVASARLTWFGGPNADKRPGTLGTAFLRLDIDYSWSGTATGTVPAEEFSLHLPGGAVVKAQDLDPQDDTLWVAFQVPADFTTGTVVVSGSAVSPSGQMTTVNSGANLAINIPKG